ncbi:MAG: 1-acyl-sn-glycerol-3-phosphate acyltransferase [Candidatus Pelagadaptatus aseana]|uniref:lysophospholipid acyltransferase family protein n=1 Tax=Candidatus Pelagadaptatus aseana TaxID=3120508 RepID=UPI0039B2D371
MSQATETSAKQDTPRQTPVTLATYFRSSLFYFLLFAFTALYGLILAISALILPLEQRCQLARIWSIGTLTMARVICGVRYKVTGLENIPDKPCVVMSKHQSAWETYFLQNLFAPQATVLKAELLRIPIFGWGLKALEPIAIDRSLKRNALKEVIKQGGERLAQGRWVVIFPEGTRVAPGQSSTFANSGALLAQKNGAQVLPVAHNAGECWPGRSVLLTPGVIQLVIGPVIDSTELSAKELGQQTQDWINSTMKAISEFE